MSESRIVYGPQLEGLDEFLASAKKAWLNASWSSKTQLVGWAFRIASLERSPLVEMLIKERDEGKAAK